MSNVTAIPEGKGTPEDKREHEAFVNGEANLRHEGITPLTGDGYDPNAGSSYPKTQRPEPTYGPLLVTDPGQPEDITAKGITRESAKPLDKSLDTPQKPVVHSRGTGRKARTSS